MAEEIKQIEDTQEDLVQLISNLQSEVAQNREEINRLRTFVPRKYWYSNLNANDL